MFDLVVAYRIYPGISKVPAFYAHDKYKLSRMCLSSFRTSLGGLRTKVYAILDGCPPIYDELFKEVLQDCELEIIHTEKIGNLATFSLQIDLLTKQTDAEIVYFAEDDYFYLPNALEDMVAFMRANKDVDFVTPYDHPDSYFTSSRHERHQLRPYGDRYWRTASSTCLTFLTTRRTLVFTARMFRTYSAGNMDCPIWLALTQRSELANIRVHFSSWFRTRTWLKSWRWGVQQILLNRRYLLWAPLPALGTHMESTCLAPLIDWESIFSAAEKIMQSGDPFTLKAGTSSYGI